MTYIVHETACGRFGRWYIRQAEAPWLAWSGDRWVEHDMGLPYPGESTLQFDTEALAQLYIDSMNAAANGLDARRIAELEAPRGDDGPPKEAP
ncbi:MAG: hypothetical protein ABSD56_10710 [Bryobacteraceae bacterium]|jgi:hypothetical protein